MSPTLTRIAVYSGVAVPILWTLFSHNIPDLPRSLVASGLVLVACVWGAADGLLNDPWLAVNMASGALVGLVCRYPRHGGEAHRASVSLYEDIAFSAGFYGVMTCLFEALFL